MSVLLGFLFSYHNSQLLVTPTSPTADFTGQTIIVTGASSDLGLEAARHFVRRKASLIIIAVRNVKKGEQAKESIVSTESTHHPDISSCIQVWELDLAKYDSVKAFAKRVETLNRLDKVVENAGVYPTKFEIAEGEEMGITVNVVSTFLLALLLLPKLRESGRNAGITPVISVTGSLVHWLTQFPERNEKEGIFDTPATKEKANMRDRYLCHCFIPISPPPTLRINMIKELSWEEYSDPCQTDIMSRSSYSSTLCVNFACLISGSDKTPPVVLNISNPGFCRSNIMREATGLWLLSIEGMKIVLARTTEIGSRTVVAGAVGGLDTHGQYLNDCHPVK